MAGRQKAAILNARARRRQNRGKTDEAIALYRQAAEADPTWSVPHYNLGLLFKNARQWKESLQHNRRAAQLDPKNEAALWNFGIAATALGRWNLARQAWRGFGIDVPDGNGPIDYPCGSCPIRLNPDGDAEVVWARRIDPARAVLVNIPFPESGHRWRDTVLHDGAPVGYRKWNDQDVPVFNELQLLQSSEYNTFITKVRLPKELDSSARFLEIATRLDGCAEDWSTSVRILCKKCSEGRPHSTHDTEAAPPTGVHLIGLAAKNEKHASRIVRAWELEVEGVQVEDLERTSIHDWGF